jgi:hypothetical protein
MRFPPALRLESAINNAIDLDICFAGSHFPLPDHVSIGLVTIGPSHRLVPHIAGREARIRHKQEFRPPALVLAVIYKRPLFTFSLDSILKFAGLRALPDSMLVEQPTQMLWATRIMNEAARSMFSFSGYQKKSKSCARIARISMPSETGLFLNPGDTTAWRLMRRVAP